MDIYALGWLSHAHTLQRIPCIICLIVSLYCYIGALDAQRNRVLCDDNLLDIHALICLEGDVAIHLAFATATVSESPLSSGVREARVSVF